MGTACSGPGRDDEEELAQLSAPRAERRKKKKEKKPPRAAHTAVWAPQGLYRARASGLRAADGAAPRVGAGRLPRGRV